MCIRDSSLSLSLSSLSLFSVLRSDSMELDCIEISNLVKFSIQLFRQPLEEIRRVEQFLDIPKFYSEKNFVFPNSGSRFPCFVTEKDEMFCMGKEKGREHPKLKEETVLLLKNHFKPMIDEFYTLTGIRLNIDQ